jgi:serine/threonine protein kinase/Tol biopolymer transport system component
VKDGRWERVESLFASALERPTEQRAEHVRTATPDAEVASEVLSLLRAYDGRGRLDSLTDHLRGLAAVATEVSASSLVERLAPGLARRDRFEREIGRGGMSIVFLVEDLRHHRRVALKVLHPGIALSLGAPRFLQEIGIVAQLAHPHILPLHDSGEVDGLLYYVMPYVEGESLRDRLLRERQLPLAAALGIAREVADALSYAHRLHIVHRDIKPENILLLEGHAVVTDFGIAWAMTAAGAWELSETGVILGTPAYMSPEQATPGQPADGRADVYALGCVLFEMLAGKPPFADADAEALLARKRAEAVPSVRSARRTVPRPVERALRRALAASSTDRHATAAEFSADLGHADVVVAAAPRSRLRRTARVVVLLAAAAGLAALTRLLRGPSSRPVTQYGLVLPPSQAPLDHTPFAISPDGARLAYVGPAGRGSQLWIKSRDRIDVTPLPGTDDVDLAAFSPDGRWVAYVQHSHLKKQRVTGAAAITLTDPDAGPGAALADSASVYGVAWLDDGTLVYFQPGGYELRRIAETGGPSQVIWRPGSGNMMHPTPLPGGRGVLVVRWCVPCGRAMNLWAVDLRHGGAHLVQRDVVVGFYVPTGHLVFATTGGALMAAPFDLRSLKESGPPHLIRDSLAVEAYWMSTIALSQEGTLVARGSTAGVLRRYGLVWVDRAGRETPVDSTWTFQLTQAPGDVGWSLSPDGKRLAIGLSTGAGDHIWVKHLPNGPARLVGRGSGPAEYRPRWWRDGRSLLYEVSPSGDVHRRFDGDDGPSSVLLRGFVHGNNIQEVDVTSDGRWLVVAVSGNVLSPTGRDIYAMRLGVDTAPQPLLATRADESEVALSPDGHWIAYVSDETGTPEVYLRPFPNVNAARYRMSSGYGVAPLWSRSGRELFFVNGDREMMAVRAVLHPTVQLGEPRFLFRMDPDLYLGRGEYYTPYDISPDDQRFIMARRVDIGVGASPPLLITENWFTELRRVLATSDASP